MYRNFSLLAVVFCLAACAGLSGERLDAVSAGRIKKAGVVSLLGNTFSGTKIGITVFENATYAGDITEWNMDKFASRRMEDLLRGTSPFPVVQLERAGQPDDKLLTGDRQALWDLAAQQNVDALIVLEPRWFVGVGRNYPGPFGQIFVSRLLRSDFNCLYVSYRAVVYDVRQRKAIGNQDTQVCEDEFRNSSLPPFHDSLAAYSDSEKVAIKREIERKLSRSLDDVLVELNIRK